MKSRTITNRETLGGDQWLSLIKQTHDDGTLYTYSHEVRCNGQIVVILPYRRQQGFFEYLIRNEYAPAWSLDELQINAITGGVDTGMNPLSTAKKELLEEAGFSVDITDFESLGVSRGTKSSDTVYHIFAVDLTDKIKTHFDKTDEPFEDEAINEWYSMFDKRIQVINDPLLSTAILRFLLTTTK